MIKFIKKLLFSCLVISSCVNNSFGSQMIYPRSLKILVEQSENIIIARVLKVEKNPGKGNIDIWQNSIATLLIKEVLKGDISTDTIKVFFGKGYTCPRPDSYVPHRTVLAFIDKHKPFKRYHTPALSYGTKYPSKEGLALYKKRIVEMLQIMKMKPSQQKIQQTIDWLIECAKYPVTRWEGTFEFYPPFSDSFMYSYDDDNDVAVKKHVLSLTQKSKIRAILFSIQKMKYFDFGLIDWAAEKGDQEMADFLIKKLKALGQENSWPALTYIKNIAFVTDRKDLKKLAQHIRQLSDKAKTQEIDYTDYDQQRTSLLKKFISLL